MVVGQMVLGFWDIARPIVGAPMAGGVGTPALAAAVSNAGGLGFVAGGYLSADQFADDIAAARKATTGPLGVNLYVPQPSVADFLQLDYYADELEDVAEHFQVEVGRPDFGWDDDWARKLEVVADVRPELVSFTFGVPSPDVIRRLGAQGLLVMVTVTSAYEAGVAIAAGADSLVVQGPDAGGHRGTFAPDMEPGTESLHELLAHIHSGTHREVPLIAAGGLGTAEDIDEVLNRGAVAAQVGTALMLSDEAGTHPAHRAAMKNPLYAKTIVSRAFSGRYGRSLENKFIRQLDRLAPLGYPEVNQMTAPIRAAAADWEDPEAMTLWAGTAFAQAQAGPAGDIVAILAGD
jgi:nitronate monooxygenase